MLDPLFGYAELTDEVWLRLERAAEDRADPARLMTLCTVDGRGDPEARLMGLRGVDRLASTLWFYTDRRSRKVEQLLRRPAACVLAYDPRDGVQITVRGAARVHAQNAEASRHWEQLEIAAGRLAARGERGGGEGDDAIDPRMRAMVAAVRERPRGAGRDTFAVMELAAAEIGWLQVCGDAQRRALLLAEEGWRARAV